MQPTLDDRFAKGIVTLGTMDFTNHLDTVSQARTQGFDAIVHKYLRKQAGRRRHTLLLANSWVLQKAQNQSPTCRLRS